MISQYKKIIISILSAIGIGGVVTFGATNFGAFSDSYQVIAGVKGYVSKSDPTNTPPDFLARGSQNVIINDQEKVESRSGYKLFGVASTSANPISADFTWKHSGATSSVPAEILLRVSNNTLQYYATSSFQDLFTQVATSSPIRFATVWNTTELIDILLFVNASSTLFEWSGGQATYASSTATSIGINEDIDSSRFFTSGTRSIRVQDSSGVWRQFDYTTTGTKTFNGITPDPTTFTFGDKARVVQTVRHNINKPATGFVNSFVKVLNNQVFLGSQNSRTIYVSQDTSYTTFTFSSPRIVGEGALIHLDDTPIGFESPDDEKMLVFLGRDRIYQVTFEVSPGSTADREVPRIKPLLVSAGGGAISQELVGKIKQSVVWITNNKELVEFGQVENLPSPQTVAISDPIKPDFLDADFTNGEIEFWRNNILITDPPNSKVFVYDLSKRFWQAPQIMGMRRLSQFGGLLYGHSSSVAETYQLFTGLNDNTNPIEAKAHFVYSNANRRDALKNFDRYFTEVFLASNTKLNVSILYEWMGAKSIQTYELDGADQKFLFSPVSDASLGVNPLGTNPLGGLTSISEDLPKYRRFKPLVPIDYFEYQVRFESNGTDLAWQLLAHGPNTKISDNKPVGITR